jgi:hypothetical protein
MDHHALSERCLVFGNSGPSLDNHAAWLMAGNDTAATLAVTRQITPAHARGAYPDDYLARSR